MPKGDNITEAHASRIPAGDPSRDRKQRLYPYTRRVLQLLIASYPDALTSAEIMEALNMNKNTAQGAIDWLKSEELCHIAEWKRGTGPIRRAWAAGNGMDAKKPKPLSASEKCRKWRANSVKENSQKIARGMTMAGQLGV